MWKGMSFAILEKNSLCAKILLQDEYRQRETEGIEGYEKDNNNEEMNLTHDGDVNVLCVDRENGKDWLINWDACFNICKQKRFSLITGKKRQGRNCEWSQYGSYVGKFSKAKNFWWKFGKTFGS